MTWEKKRVLVTVTAYPEKSKKYGQVVCTIGLTEEGDWIRLYPVPFNVFSGPRKLRKYDWIEVECKRAEEKLSRKESYRIRNAPPKIIDRSLSLRKIKGIVDWNERNKILLGHIAPSLEDLQEKFDEDRTSIGLIKPTEVLEFYKRGDLQIYQDPKVFQQSLFGAKIPEIEEIPHLFAIDSDVADARKEKSIIFNVKTGNSLSPIGNGASNMATWTFFGRNCGKNIIDLC